MKLTGWPWACHSLNPRKQAIASYFWYLVKKIITPDVIILGPRYFRHNSSWPQHFLFGLLFRSAFEEYSETKCCSSSTDKENQFNKLKPLLWSLYRSPIDLLPIDLLVKFKVLSPMKLMMDSGYIGDFLFQVESAHLVHLNGEGML